MSLGGGLRIARSPIGVEAGAEAVIKVESDDNVSGDGGVIYDVATVAVCFKSAGVE